MKNKKKTHEIAEEVAEIFINTQSELLVDKELLMTIIMVALGMFIEENGLVA